MEKIQGSIAWTSKRVDGTAHYQGETRGGSLPKREKLREKKGRVSLIDFGGYLEKKHNNG